MIELFTSRSGLRYLASGSMLVLLLAAAIRSGDHSQDLNFRLNNIERRLDQLQTRVDFVERTLQSQSFNRAGDANASSALVIELQRQQLSLAQQVVSMQKQMLTLQQKLDQLQEKGSEKGPEKGENQKERPKGEAKPKPPQSRQ